MNASHLISEFLLGRDLGRVILDWMQVESLNDPHFKTWFKMDLTSFAIQISFIVINKVVTLIKDFKDFIAIRRILFTLQLSEFSPRHSLGSVISHLAVTEVQLLKLFRVWSLPLRHARKDIAKEHDINFSQ